MGYNFSSAKSSATTHDIFNSIFDVHKVLEDLKFVYIFRNEKKKNFVFVFRAIGSLWIPFRTFQY